jgi:hypothetical protein
VLLIAEVIGGPPNHLTRASLLAAAWIIHIAIAECVFRYRRPAPHPEACGSATGAPRAEPIQPALRST